MFIMFKLIHLQGPTKAKPSKPADETDSEGIIEDSDEDDFKTSIALSYIKRCKGNNEWFS